MSSLTHWLCIPPFRGRVMYLGMLLVWPFSAIHAGATPALALTSNTVASEVDIDFPEKSVRGASQVAVCNGKRGGEALSCKMAEKTPTVPSSIFAMTASGWHLISVSYDAESKLYYYYFSLD